MVNSKRTRTRCARNTMQGGGLGNGHHLGTEMLARGYAAIEPYSSCGALSRPGMMSTDLTSAMGKGIPGITGGGKRSRKGKRTQRKNKQRGGRYDMVMAGAEFEALGPRGGMMATAMRAPCEAGQGSPLPSPTQITAPPFSGGGKQRGGSAQLAPAPFLQEQTAGYTQMSSKWLDSVGAPVQLHEPIGGRMASPACGQTGGKRREGKRREGKRGQRGGTGAENAAGATGAANGAANGTATGAANGAANGTATGAANGAANGTANGTATGAANGTTPVTAATELTTSANDTATSANSTATSANGEPVKEGGRRKQRKASRKNRKASRKASRKQRK